MRPIPCQQQLLLREATAHSQSQSQLPANNSSSSERILTHNTTLRKEYVKFDIFLKIRRFACLRIKKKHSFPDEEVETSRSVKVPRAF